MIHTKTIDRQLAKSYIYKCTFLLSMGQKIPTNTYNWLLY